MTTTEKKKKFIVDVAHLALILALGYVALQYALPLLMPFVIAFVIAYILRRPIRFLSRTLHVPKGLVAVLLVVLTYGLIGTLLALAGIRLIATVTSLVEQIPGFYYAHILPALTDAFTWLEDLLSKLDPSLMAVLEELQTQLIDMLRQLVSVLPSLLMGGVSAATALASSLPGFLIRLLLMVISTFFIAIDYEKIVRFLIRLLLMVISTFFIAIDYEKIVRFILGCLRGNTRNVVLQIKAYVVGTLFVCIRSYALIMSITFVELSIGLSVVGVERAMLVALLIAIFDILPVLGTGGIMIPWAILTALGGEQIGLHPVLTLMSMFVGTHLFGVVGLFGLPILLSLLRYLNDTGTISLFPASALGREEPRQPAEQPEHAPEQEGP